MKNFMKKLIFSTVIFLTGFFVTLGTYTLMNKTAPPESTRKQPAPPAPTITYHYVDMNVSAYCPCEKCCGRFADGITASGKPAVGKLIAAPSDYAFGTVMDVPGYGEAVVLDRGGAIKGNKIDLLFPTHQEALNWGRQYLKVKVVMEGRK